MRLFRADAHPVRRWLWLGGSWVGLFVLVVVVSQAFARLTNPSHRLELGGDFLPAYAAGTLVREGTPREVYQPDVVAQIEQRVVTDANLEPLPFYGPYLNPPFFAAFHAPLSALPYRQAAVVWLSFNLLCLGASILLLCRMLPSQDGWRTWGLVPLLIVVSIPFWQAICHLQNTCLSLFILCAVVWLWRSAASRPLAAVGAGMLTGLLAYKPQLACLVAAVLVLTLGWRALVGCCVCGAALLVLTLWKLPGTLTTYLRQLPESIRQIQERPQYHWGRQVTPRGFWRLLLEGHAGGAAHLTVTILACITVALVSFGLAAALWRFLRGRRDAGSLDQLIAATIAAMPLLMPYYMDYDLLLLAIPAVLLANDWMRRGSMPNGTARMLPWAWTGLYLALYINPGLSGQSRLNLAAPLVGLVAALLVLRCLRTKRTDAVGENLERTPLATAA